MNDEKKEPEVDEENEDISGGEDVNEDDTGSEYEEDDEESATDTQKE